MPEPNPPSPFNKLTEGSILRSLVSLAFPIIMANILQTTYQLIDTFWLGRLGAKAVTPTHITPNRIRPTLFCFFISLQTR